MTPPGLTCIDCDQPLYPHAVCITTDGWRHVHCQTAKDTCNTCQTTMISAWAWGKLDDKERHAALSAGKRRKSGPGLCSRCANAAYKTRLRQEREQAKADRLEDICWMAEHGESLIGAARRLAMSVSGVEHFLVRAHRRDVLDTLTRRNPADHNRQTAGVAVVRRPDRERARAAA